MEQFTASEVRDLAKRGTDAMQQFIDGRHTLHVPPQFDDADMVIAECLRAVDAFADMLEAQEKAEAIGFLSGGALAALVDCRSDDYNGNVDLWMRSNDAVKATIPVYTRPSPSDAERLAEALEHTARHRAAADRIDPDQWRSVLYSWEDRALVAHSAQAQLPINHSDEEPYPDAAKDPFWKVPGMVDTRPKAQTPAASVTDAMVERGLKACIQDSDARLPRYKVVRSIIEAALAAQENPNG